MTPLLPNPDHYLNNLIAMTSTEAKRLWRRSIKEHFDNTCIYCGKSHEFNVLTLDHLHAKANGGKDTAKNLVCSCQKCNQEKGTQHWRDFVNTPIRASIIENYIKN